MAELYHITKAEKARHIDELPFQDELADLEPFIKENPQLLGESIEIFAEQVDTGLGDKIDLLGLNRSAGAAQIIIIELKAGLAQQQVLLQTLRYASWIKNNPDSIRLLLERKRISIEKVDFTPKVVIVAPQIDPALIELSQYTQAFEFDFVEVRRFGSKENCYLVVDLKTLPKTSVSRARSQEEWSWERYETELGINKERIHIGKSIFDKLSSITQENQWSLTPRFRQYYVPFQFGSRNVILISYWITSQYCYLGFKLPQPPEQMGLNEPHPEAEHRWVGEYSEYYVRIDKADCDLSGYIPFMEAAYRHVSKA